MKPIFLAAVACTALCETPLCAESAYRILAAADLTALASRFEPGDVVLLPDVTWENQRLTFRGKGTPEKPITLKATNPGKFVLTGKSSLVVDGEWLVVEGVTFSNAGVEGAEGIGLKGSNHRLTSSVIDGSTHKYAVRLHGTNHRVDHCYLAHKTTEGPTLQIEVDAKEPNYHRIDHNHFGVRSPLGQNGGETIRIGYSHQSMSNSRTTVEHNLFERCDGEIEIISSKSCENTYRSNTFRECDGMLTLRHGNRNIVDGNFFLGGRKPNSGGIRVIGEDHVVINNYIEGVMKGGVWITCGVPNSALHQYYQVKRALIAFNTIVDSAGPYLDLAAGLGGANRTLKPEAITVANNVFVLGDGGTLLQGDEGENWQWLGNLASNSPRVHEGIRVLDPKLERARDGLFRPATDSPARQSAEGDFSSVTADVDGQPRTGRKNAGCDETSDAVVLARPLTAAEVGPAWRR
jgi:poly(beta-D-mannuronate) lyase